MLRFCALWAQVPDDRDIVASCDTNASGLPALTVDELSFSRGDCDASDDTIKLRSSRDCATPGEGSSSLTCIWRFRHDLVNSQKKMAAREHRYIHDIDKSQKSVPSMTSKRSFSLHVSELALGVKTFHLDHGGQG